MNRFAFAAALATVLSTSAVLPAQAQESLTLKKLKDTSSITLGHRESSIPFSYYNDQQQVIGYSQELMLKA
ncbi:MAG TPA: amino acid ABC transporter substrate-binding protein, partial [Azonexus sp.]|nr:amino acid ABC transporter substrate-binding protein [Azonexus sp.]